MKRGFDGKTYQWSCARDVIKDDFLLRPQDGLVLMIVDDNSHMPVERYQQRPFQLSVFLATWKSCIVGMLHVSCDECTIDPVVATSLSGSGNGRFLVNPLDLERHEFSGSFVFTPDGSFLGVVMGHCVDESDLVTLIGLSGSIIDPFFSSDRSRELRSFLVHTWPGMD